MNTNTTKLNSHYRKYDHLLVLNEVRIVKHQITKILTDHELLDRDIEFTLTHCLKQLNAIDLHSNGEELN